MITVEDAHTSDVNVASWNIQQPGTLLTGADDGCVRVWDLRMVNRVYGLEGNRDAGDITAYTHSFNVRLQSSSIILPFNSISAKYHLISGKCYIFLISVVHSVVLD